MSHPDPVHDFDNELPEDYQEPDEDFDYQVKKDLEMDIVRERLIERAKDAIDYSEGTVQARMMEMMVENKDWEALNIMVSGIEANIAQDEMHGRDVLPHLEWDDVF